MDGRTSKEMKLCHNPYFTGNSFSIKVKETSKQSLKSHNPYFTGNTFAIEKEMPNMFEAIESQSLFYWKTPLQLKYTVFI